MTLRSLKTATDLEQGIAALCRIEPLFSDILVRAGTPSLRLTGAGFQALAGIIVEQSISLKAAAAIHARLTTRVRPFDASRVSRTRLETLRGIGLTSGKARAIKSLATAIGNGRIDLEAIAGMSDGEAVSALTRLPGIGPWTAHIYLLSALGRPDAWPAGDVALQVALADAFRLARRPSASAMERISEPWRPWRAVAARLLWAHYRLMKSMPQAS